MLRALALTLFLPAAATADTYGFDVTLAGVKVATMQVTGEAAEGGYRATAQVATRGLAGVVRPVFWDARVEGIRKGNRLMPSAYREKIDTGRRWALSVLAWEGGVPTVRVHESSEPVGVAADPAWQAGTVDPLTALYAGLTDDGTCRLSLQLFDGRRRSAVALADPQPVEGGVLCRGQYRRLQGFTAAEMAERPGFDFDVLYLPGPDGVLRPARIETDTLYGRAVLQRR